jgi:hypothetical protein
VKAKRDTATSIVPLRINPTQRTFLLRHPRYRRTDVCELHRQAVAFVQGKLPVPDRETAIALLLSRDGQAIVR